ncbi:MAG: hypothetical protein QGF48_08640 [Qipengyuania citrea]|jgi:hypothetical protein|nr:hypothetical protein [Qipengyuania citrea]
MENSKLKSIEIKCFLSCSFDPSDSDLNDTIGAICKGLDIKAVNVSVGSSKLPPDQAMSLIEESEGLIAICVKREKLENGSYNMPQAVNDEIAFAYGRDVPILAFVEKGVNKGGFTQKFRTYHEFDRSKIQESKELEKIIKAIHDFKVSLLCDDHVPQLHDPSDSYAEDLRHLVELKEESGEFFWEYTTSKKIVYQRHSSRSFPVSVFATGAMEIPEDADDIEWEFQQDRASRNIKLVPTIDERSPSKFEARLRPEPAAEKNDSIEYTVRSRSRYLLPLWSDQVIDEKFHYLEKGNFKLYDGLLFIHRAKSALVEFRFPRAYGMAKDDFCPFVASYTTGIDFEVTAERDRIDISKDDFGGAVVFRFHIQSALPNHVYGVAWNPPKRPAQ